MRYSRSTGMSNSLIIVRGLNLSRRSVSRIFQSAMVAIAARFSGNSARPLGEYPNASSRFASNSLCVSWSTKSGIRASSFESSETCFNSSDAPNLAALRYAPVKSQIRLIVCASESVGISLMCQANTARVRTVSNDVKYPSVTANAVRMTHASCVPRTPSRIIASSRAPWIPASTAKSSTSKTSSRPSASSSRRTA